MQSLQSRFTIWSSIGLMLIAGCLILYSAISQQYIVLSMIESSEEMVNGAAKEISDSILEMARARLRESARAQALQVESSLNGAIYSARTFANLMTGLKSKGASASGISRERIILLVKGVLEQDKIFLAAYTGWEPDQFDGFGFAYENLEGHDRTGRFIPYWYRRSNGQLKLFHLTDYENRNPHANGIRFGEYYLRPRELKKECIIGPRRKKLGDDDYWITSLTAPIISGEKFFGVAGVDVNLDLLQHLSEKVAADLDINNSRVQIISHEGVIAADSKTTANIGQLAPDRSERDIVKNGREHFSLENGAISIMYPLKIGAAGTPWSVKINVSKDLVLAQAVNIQSNMEISLKEIHEKLKKKNNRGLTMQLLFGVVLTIVIVFIIYVLAKKELRKRRRAEKELLKARNYISNIIDSMPSVLVGVDAEGKVTQWNSEARRATGVPAERAVGRPLDQAFPRLAADMARVREAIASRAEQSDSKRAWKEDGETRYEDVSVYPLIANGVEGAVIRVDDVTERVRLEEMMVQSEKMLSVGGLAAGMAHEINNPLAGMMQTANVMAGRLLTESMPANERAAVEAGASMAVIRRFMEIRGVPGMIKTINESGRRLAAIVDNMLSFARKSDDRTSSYALSDLLDKTLALAATDYDLKKRYDFKKIKVRKEYEDNLPPAPCESAKIQQVLLNLLRNGSQAMQEAGIENPGFIVRTRFEEERGMVRIEIEDNGPGMDEATRKRVFEPFFTTKPVGVGTGLGLSVSYFIITENHGGEMTVESRPGEGAKFIIRLPAGRRD